MLLNLLHARLHHRNIDAKCLCPALTNKFTTESLKDVFRKKLLKLTAIIVLLFNSGQLLGVETARLLSEAGDPKLQQALEKIVRQQGLEKAVEKKQLALALVILTDPANPHLAELNGHDMLYAASLPKIAILLAAAVEIDDGRLVLDEPLYKDLTDMIRYSCNPCATRVLDRVGRQELLDILQSPEYRFYDQQSYGGLWVGKPYGPESAYKRDPMAGLSHAATAFQAARFYYKLHTRTLVSPEQSRMMLEILSKPGISHKFVKGLESYEGVRIYRKSGTWKTFHADSALVRLEGYAYIIVALAHSPDGAVWLERLAAPLHELAISGLVGR
jgi:beta-lactamase class A